jgi:hypothetical protein
MAKSFLISKLAGGVRTKFRELETMAKNEEDISRSALYQAFDALGDAIKSDHKDNPGRPATWWMPTEAQKALEARISHTMEEAFAAEEA